MPNTQPSIVVRTLIQSSDWIVDVNAIREPITAGDVVKLRRIDAPAMFVICSVSEIAVECGWFTALGDYKAVHFPKKSLVKLRQKG